MWDLPRPELEPVSPALAGGFLTTVPPGNPLEWLLKKKEKKEKETGGQQETAHTSQCLSPPCPTHPAEGKAWKNSVVLQTRRSLWMGRGCRMMKRLAGGDFIFPILGDNSEN